MPPQDEEDDVRGELRDANEQLLVSALREQELAGRANEAVSHLTALLQTMTEGVTVFDGNGQIVLVNAVGRNILGCFLGADLQAADYDRCDLRDQDGKPIRFADRFLQRLLRGESFSEEPVVLVKPSGEQRHLVFSGNAVRDGNGVTLAVNVYRDVTELRNLTALREQYVGLVSHDLRGPLTAAKASVELLERPGLEEPMRQSLVGRIRRSLSRMERMIDDLLDSLQLRAGERMPLVLAVCDLSAIAREVVEELKGSGRITLGGEPSLPGIWSRDHVWRAIWNLVSNALKYSEPGSEVEVRVEKSGNHACVSVRNRGNVIPVDEQPRLFDAFVRSRAAKAGGQSGWGLGLTLVRGCAEAHGGRTLIRSTPEEGTVFTLELPLAPGEPGSG